MGVVENKHIISYLQIGLLAKVEQLSEMNTGSYNLICHGSNSPQLCCDQNFTEQSEVGANTPQLCCGEIY